MMEDGKKNRWVCDCEVSTEGAVLTAEAIQVGMDRARDNSGEWLLFSAPLEGRDNFREIMEDINLHILDALRYSAYSSPFPQRGELQHGLSQDGYSRDETLMQAFTKLREQFKASMESSPNKWRMPIMHAEPQFGLHTHVSNLAVPTGDEIHAMTLAVSKRMGEEMFERSAEFNPEEGRVTFDEPLKLGEVFLGPVTADENKGMTINAGIPSITKTDASTITELDGSLRKKTRDAFDNIMNPAALRTGELSGCQHEWRHYQGFTESYDYCVKCDEKKR